MTTLIVVLAITVALCAVLVFIVWLVTLLVVAALGRFGIHPFVEDDHITLPNDDLHLSDGWYWDDADGRPHHTRREQ